MSLDEGVRSFFSLKYVIPGYTFILVILFFNIFPVIRISETMPVRETFAAILAFVTILTGGAIGFLVSQVWWWKYNRDGQILGIKQFESEYDLVKNKTKNLPSDEKKKKATAVAILDLTMFLEKDERLINNVWRRWDIYNLVGSTSYTLIIALFISAGIRIITHFSNFSQFNSNITYVELPYLIFIGSVIVALFFLFCSLKNNIASNYYHLHNALIIRNMKAHIKELKAAFPDYFPENKEEKLPNK